MVTNLGECDAGTNSDLASSDVDGITALQPSGRQHNFVVAWDSSTNETGVAALRDDRRTGIRAGAHHR